MDNLKTFEAFDEEEDYEFELGDKVVYLRPGYRHDNEVGIFGGVRDDGKFRLRFEDGTRFAADSDYVYPEAKKRKEKKPPVNRRREPVDDWCGKENSGGCGGGYNYGGYGYSSGCGGMGRSGC